MLLTEHHLEFLRFKGGCTGSSETTLVKMTHCWKSHVAAQIKILMVYPKSPSAFKKACRIILFPYTQSNDNLLKHFYHFFIRCSGPGVVLIVSIPDISLVSIPDICLLPYFLYSHENRFTRNTVYCAILSDQIVVGCPLGVPISYYFICI